MLIEDSKQESKKTICNVILIDASGSMGSKATQVISDLKELFNGIRTNTDVNHHTIVCDFSGPGDFRVLVNSTNAGDLKDSIAESYKVRGNTALREAIVKAFDLVPKDIEGVFVNILTDGQDNSWSTEYTVERIKTLIDAKNEAKWGITFMGTSQEAVLEAQKMGIDLGNTFVMQDSSAGMSRGSTARMKSMNAYTASYAVSASMDAVSNTGLMTDAKNSTDSPFNVITTTNTESPIDKVKSKK